MLLQLADTMAYLNTVSELSEDVLEVRATTVELPTPATAEGEPRAQEGAATGIPTPERKAWVPSGLGFAALSLKVMRTVLRHAPKRVVPDPERETLELAIETALTKLKAARGYLKVVGRQPLNHIQAGHSISDAEDQCRAAGVTLRALLNAVLDAVLAPPQPPETTG